MYYSSVSIVTLTTDFGTSDGYVGAMKGVILSRASHARIVDIAHDLPRFDVAAAAYCLRQAAPYFPDGTIHVAVVDPGVGTGRKAVIADDGRSLFVAPDNGILELAVPAPRAAHAIEAPAFLRGEISSTFHGRDVFAAAAGFLAAGGRAADAGPEVSLSPLPARAGVALVREEGGALRTPVVYVDRFGNLITSCPGAVVPASARIRVGEQVVIEGLRRTFADVARGELVAYIGSADTLEIAVREDSAASVLGLGAGAEVVIEHAHGPGYGHGRS
jgi:S-adenosyl-L-methionine hydrolase (adenosine-forming)